ncbi:hypothetical protein CK227_24975 [Mesorhizobium sp. WSM4308]|nr:hypothetical protein CK232_24390 [Mesorhizobium sp. WSM4304]PBB72907.1 hypothetical protein CK227_24975 [Mesorhizobium sp. WSM4308]
MGKHGVEIFAKPVSPDHLSDASSVAAPISNSILKAAKNPNPKAATKSARAEATANKTRSIGGVGDKGEVLHDEISNSVVRIVLTAYRSDYFPILLLLAGYTLFAFGAALILLLWMIA